MNGVDRALRQGVVVDRFVQTAPRAGFVRSLFGHIRMQWLMDAATTFPTLAFVPLGDLLRLEQVEPYFEPSNERDGMFATPDNVETDVNERTAARCVPQHFLSVNIYLH